MGLGEEWEERAVTSFAVSRAMSVASIIYPVAFIGTGITVRRLRVKRILSMRVGSKRPIRGMPEDFGRRKRRMLGLVSGRSKACSLVMGGLRR